MRSVFAGNHIEHELIFYLCRRLLSKSLTKKLRSLRIGWRRSLLLFLTQRPRSQKIGMMKRVCFLFSLK
jgi:hypothetical protein